jgi:hypothetical protein
MSANNEIIGTTIHGPEVECGICGEVYLPENATDPHFECEDAVDEILSVIRQQIVPLWGADEFLGDAGGYLAQYLPSDASDEAACEAIERFRATIDRP